MPSIIKTSNTNKEVIRKRTGISVVFKDITHTHVSLD